MIGVYVNQIIGFNYYKIGVTRNIRSRMGSLTAIPFEVKTIRKYPLTWGVAKSVESSLHKYFDSHRVKGEWFELGMKELKEIDRLVTTFAGDVPKEEREIQQPKRYKFIENPYKVYRHYKLIESRLKKSSKRGEIIRTVYCKKYDVSDGQMARIIYCGLNNESLFRKLSEDGDSVNQIYHIIRDLENRPQLEFSI